MSEALIQINNLTTSFGHGENQVNVVDDISFKINRGETFVLLGESGSGKSITALSIMRLLPPAARINSGQVILNEQNLFNLPESKMRDIRGANIGMIFQEPQTS
ncbi:MAG: ATP-binding cassette domain-containing protein, partial [Proteobacteria bacterium]|nr:ATP-binding cassette domain-containing protein [Pseudomonadota bacterium]